MTDKKIFTLVASGIAILFLLGVVSYAVLYTYHREEIIAYTTKCNYQFIHPETVPKMRAPDGSMAPVQTPCLLSVAPPPLHDLIRGRIAFTDIPQFMQVNRYTFLDMLLGRYSISPTINISCDQSATTTDCATLPVRQQTEPEQQPPYVPPNPVQPTETWVSATDTPISFNGFSFRLPAGWHGSVYKEMGTKYIRAFIQSDSNPHDFFIACPPAGKGLEAATRLSHEERSFTSDDGMSYTVAFDKWTSSGNTPWYFFWVIPQQENLLNDSNNHYCLAQGSAVPDIEKAMRTMYESWE